MTNLIRMLKVLEDIVYCHIKKHSCQGLSTLLPLILAKLGTQ